ncbi:MAG: hypothetical protein QXQ73_00285 [Desulfurococcaceae archaeon]
MDVALDDVRFSAVDAYDHDEFLHRAEIIGRLGEVDGQISDEQCQLTDRVVKAIEDSQLVDLLKPRRYGGLGVDLKSYYELISTIARHNMATAWIAYFYSIHQVWPAYMAPQARDEIIVGGGNVADVLAPVGTVERDAADYLLSGQWNFASGVPHSTWIGLGAVAQLPDNDTPEYCLFAVKVAELEIVRNWNPLGLRGTGSHGVKLDRVRVPAHRVLPVERVLHKGTPLGGKYDPSELIYRIPFLPLFAGPFSAVVLGGATRIVEEFRTRTAKRTRVYLGGASAAAGGPMPATAAQLQLTLIEMQGLVDIYRMQLEDWLRAGQVTTMPEEKARLFALRAQIAQKGVDIAVKAGQALGGTALYRGDPVELFTRDLLTLGSHASHLYVDAISTYGSALFGGPAHPVW